MSRVKSHDTKPELKLRKLVWGLGYRYRKNRRDVVGRPDLTFKAKRCAIFLHGCFWHRHDCSSGNRSPKTRLDFWNKKFSDNIRRDKAVSNQLNSDGWRSLVIWECEMKRPDSVALRVRKFLDA